MGLLGSPPFFPQAQYVVDSSGQGKTEGGGRTRRDAKLSLEEDPPVTTSKHKVHLYTKKTIPDMYCAVCTTPEPDPPSCRTPSPRRPVTFTPSAAHTTPGTPTTAPWTYPIPGTPPKRFSSRVCHPGSSRRGTRRTPSRPEGKGAWAV